MSDYMYNPNYRLPVTDEIVESVLNNPDVTYADLDALSFSVFNAENMGPASDWLPIISERINEIHFGKQE